MARNQNFSQREKRKAPAAVPDVPDLGRLTMPRKTNRAAAMAVASGDVLWDKRKVDRKARKRALESQARRTSNKGFHQLSRKQKQWLANHLPDWSWDASTSALQAPAMSTRQQLDELVEVTRLPYVQRAVMKVQGLSLEEIGYVAERAPKTALFVLVDPLTKGQQTIRVARIREGAGGGPSWFGLPDPQPRLTSKEIISINDLPKWQQKDLSRWIGPKATSN